MTGELLGISADAAFALGLCAVALLIGRIAWWAITERRRHVESHAE